MLCPHLALQPSSGSLLPFLEPMRTLWPASQAIFARVEHDMIQTMKEMTRRMELMDQYHRHLLEETIPNWADSRTPNTAQLGPSQPDTTGEKFALSLAIQGFTPEELTVKLVGRKLLMTGSKETKIDDGAGSSSYRYEVFRRETELPEDVNLEELTCSVSSDSQLCIEAPRQSLPGRIERNVPIQVSSTSIIAATTTKPEEQEQAKKSKDNSKKNEQSSERKA